MGSMLCAVFERCVCFVCRLANAQGELDFADTPGEYGK
jgi:hypothetical protein